MSYQKIACQCPDAVYLLDMKGRSGVNNWCSGCKYKASWHFNAHFAPNFMQDKPESCLPNKEGNVRRWKESQLLLLEMKIWNFVWAGTLKDSMNGSATFSRAAGKNDGIC